METIKDTKFYTLKFDKENRVIEVDWKKDVLELFEEEYKKVLDEIHALFYDYRPQYLLHNSKDFIYPMTESLQQYITENFSKKVLPEVGIKKVAYVFPADYISQIGLEMLVEKAESVMPSILRMFFDNRDDAYNWLISR